MKRATKVFTSMIISLLLCMMMPASIGNYIGVGEAQAVTYMNSGRTSVAKLTGPELAALYRSIPSADGNLYATTPLSGSSYRVGILSSQSLSQAKGLINYYRKNAGLGTISFTSTLNTSASYASLVNAMNMSMSHAPSKPSYMTTTDYQKGYDAAGKSNLSGFYFTAIGSNASTYVSAYKKQIIQNAITGQMSDSDSYNIPMMGHRRWLLNPGTTTMGIGVADNHNSSGYYQYHTSIRVMGSGVSTTTVNDYNFIAWPASGYNLTEMFSRDTPWSVTLNPSVYKTPSKSAVKVTVTRTSDGKVWNLNSSTSSSKAYFNVNNSGYGVGNCIIFRPDYTDISKYSGTYTVHISGLQKVNGTAATIDYKVVFKTAAEAAALQEPTKTNTITASNFKKTYSTTAQTFSIGAKRLGTGKLTYSSNNTSVKVDSTGKVTIAPKFMGKATITIKVAADSTYKSASKQITVTVVPGATSITSLTNTTGRKMLVKWSRRSYCSGYQIQYSTSSTFASGNKTVTVSGNSNISKTISYLTKGKTYYVRVRVYKTVNSEKFYSSWSAKKYVKIVK